MPQKSVTIIYLPGLGSKYDNLRQFALKFWIKRNWNVQFLPLNWTDKTETYQEKKARVVHAVEHAKGQVVLVGESAGAAMGFIVAPENPSVKLVTLCGKIGGAASTGQHYYDLVPAFREMLPEADAIREELSSDLKPRVITVRAYKDMFLSQRDTTLPGVKEIILPSVGHLSTILLGITILRFGAFRAIKELTDR